MPSTGPLSIRSPAPTWQLLKQYVEEQISTGVYPLGAWLPSVRRLAVEMSVNRNTVSKVYQALSRDGVLEVARGKGVRVAAKPTEGKSSESRIEAAIASLVRESSLAGLSRDWLMRRFTALAESTYGNRLLRMAFVECNVQDARQIAGDLAGHLAVPVTPIDLVDLERHPAAANEFDLVTTTFFHLQEVAAILPPELEPIGINHAVSHESVLQIARLRPGSTIVVVCPNKRTLDRVRSIVETYARGQIYSFVPEDQNKLKQALSLADVAVDHFTTHDLVKDLAPTVSTITVSFHIEAQSIEYLRNVARNVARRLSTDDQTSRVANMPGEASRSPTTIRPKRRRNLT